MPKDSFPDENPVGKPGQYFEMYFTLELLKQFALCTNTYFITKNGNKELKF